MIKIIILAGKMFRGVIHFEETNYDVSDAWAQQLIKDGVARAASDPLSDPNSFKGPKGPNDN